MSQLALSHAHGSTVAVYLDRDTVVEGTLLSSDLDAIVLQPDEGPVQPVRLADIGEIVIGLEHPTGVPPRTLPLTLWFSASKRLTVHDSISGEDGVLGWLWSEDGHNVACIFTPAHLITFRSVSETANRFTVPNTLRHGALFEAMGVKR